MFNKQNKNHSNDSKKGVVTLTLKKDASEIIDPKKNKRIKN